MSIFVSMTIAVIVGLFPVPAPMTAEAAWVDCVTHAVGTDASYHACDAAYTESTGKPADLDMADYA